eukprot:2309599-Rhodomonas_salina.1
MMRMRIVWVLVAVFMDIADTIESTKGHNLCAARSSLVWERSRAQVRNAEAKFLCQQGQDVMRGGIESIKEEISRHPAVCSQRQALCSSDECGENTGCCILRLRGGGPKKNNGVRRSQPMRSLFDAQS